MQNQLTYDEFLKTKIKVSENFGFNLDIDDINPNLKPHNKLMVKWLVEGGRRACFASFGLHKTVTQLEAVRCTMEKAALPLGLIVCPLNIKQEFVQDSINILKWSDEPKFIRRPSEMNGDGIYLTNYESIRDGRLDPRIFDVASLDEASVLRGFGGSKTFREFMRLFTGDAGYTAEGCVVKNCPLQFDIADRVIEQLSNPLETVLDPFGGLMTVPYRAVLKGRKGIGIELSNPYFIDGSVYCKGAERNMKMPSLFDALEAI